MKSFILLLSLVVLINQIVAAPEISRSEKDHVSEIRNTLKRRTQQAGGYIIKPKTGTGSVAFINCQDTISHSVIANIARQLKYISRINVIAIKGAKDLKPDEAQIIHNVEVAVVIKRDTNNNSLMLLAPEDGWGMVNFSKVPSGENFKAGCCKALMRTFALLCCGGLSMQDGNLMHAAKLEGTYNLKDLLPHDVVTRQLKYLAAMNVTPKVRITYKKACEEGWAPAPTNEFQKAIWDKVHAVPKTPMKIEFDPKKGR